LHPRSDVGSPSRAFSNPELAGSFGFAVVLRERRVVPPRVERGRLLEEPQRHSKARRYVG
jgi:hypothetical protein